mgnify:CR=1 FL=1
MDESVITQIDSDVRNGASIGAKENQISCLRYSNRSESIVLAGCGTRNGVSGFPVDEACKSGAIKSGRGISARSVRNPQILLGQLDDAASIIHSDSAMVYLGGVLLRTIGDDHCCRYQKYQCKDEQSDAGMAFSHFWTFSIVHYRHFSPPVNRGIPGIQVNT